MSADKTADALPNLQAMKARPMSQPLAALPTFAEAPALPPFESAQDALHWAVEVLRRRRLPRHSGTLTNRVALSARQKMATDLARLNLAAEATQVAATWGGRFQPHLPHDAAGRLSLALQIEQSMATLPPEAARLLKLWAWGDWADEARLHAAQVHQEKLRQQGVRVRLSYRYSLEQLATLAGLSKATIWRQLQAALKLLQQGLEQQEIVSAPLALNGVPPKARKPVQRHEFGK